MDTYATIRSSRPARWVAIVGVAVVFSLFNLASADASSDRVSRGDAEAVFHAFGGGGRVILNKNVTDTGAPADSDVRAAIRPFSGSIFDGRHYCAEDWHVILIANISGDTPSWSLQEARAELASIETQFTLDGSALATTSTALKRFLVPELLGVAEAYYFQDGVVMSPSDLAVGGHTLGVTVFDGPDVIVEDEITFYIDATDTGSCSITGGSVHRGSRQVTRWPGMFSPERVPGTSRSSGTGVGSSSSSSSRHAVLCGRRTPGSRR